MTDTTIEANGTTYHVGIDWGKPTMTDTTLTDAQRATLERAQGREGLTTPGPWTLLACAMGNERQTVMYGWIDLEGYAAITVENINDRSLITDAPALQDLAVTQARIISEQTARIAALEAELVQYKMPIVNIKERPSYSHGYQFRFSVSVLSPVEVNFGLAATKKDAEARAAQWIAEVGDDISSYIDNYEDEDE